MKGLQSPLQSIVCHYKSEILSYKLQFTFASRMRQVLLVNPPASEIFIHSVNTSFTPSILPYYPRFLKIQHKQVLILTRYSFKPFS